MSHEQPDRTDEHSAEVIDLGKVRHRRARQEDQKFEEFVDRYLGLVVRLAESIQRKIRSHISIEELVQYGVIGLLEARRNYDERRRASFASFAYYRVRGAIYDGFRREGWGQRGTDCQVVETAWLDPDSGMHRTETTCAGQRKVRIVLCEHEELGEVLAAAPDASPQMLLGRSRVVERLKEAIDTLAPIEREVVIRYDLQGETLPEIAADLGCSKSWACRLRGRGLKRMREYLTAEEGAEEEKSSAA